MRTVFEVELHLPNGNGLTVYLDHYPNDEEIAKLIEKHGAVKAYVDKRFERVSAVGLVEDAIRMFYEKSAGYPSAVLVSSEVHRALHQEIPKPPFAPLGVPTVIMYRNARVHEVPSLNGLEVKVAP
jgi:hypothetical protein